MAPERSSHARDQPGRPARGGHRQCGDSRLEKSVQSAGEAGRDGGAGGAAAWGARWRRRAGARAPRPVSEQGRHRIGGAAAVSRAAGWLGTPGQTWRRPALPPLLGQYPGRGAVSRPSSEWGRVGPARCGHQVGPGVRGPGGAQSSESGDQTACPRASGRRRGQTASAPSGTPRAWGTRAGCGRGPTSEYAYPPVGGRPRRRWAGALVLDREAFGAWVAEIRCRRSEVRWQAPGDLAGAASSDL